MTTDSSDYTTLTNFLLQFIQGFHLAFVIWKLLLVNTEMSTFEVLFLLTFLHRECFACVIWTWSNIMLSLLLLF